MLCYIIYNGKNLDSSLGAAIIASTVKARNNDIKLIDVENESFKTIYFPEFLSKVKEKTIEQLYICGAYLSFTDLSYIYKMIPSKMDLFECDPHRINLCKQYGISNNENVSLNQNRSIFAQIYDHFYNIDNIHQSELTNMLSDVICLSGDSEAEKIYKIIENKFLKDSSFDFITGDEDDHYWDDEMFGAKLFKYNCNIIDDEIIYRDAKNDDDVSSPEIDNNDYFVNCGIVEFSDQNIINTTFTRKYYKWYKVDKSYYDDNGALVSDDVPEVLGQIVLTPIYHSKTQLNLSPGFEGHPAGSTITKLYMDDKDNPIDYTSLSVDNPLPRDEVFILNDDGKYNTPFYADIILDDPNNTKLQDKSIFVKCEKTTVNSEEDWLNEILPQFIKAEISHYLELKNNASILQNLVENIINETSKTLYDSDEMEELVAEYNLLFDDKLNKISYEINNVLLLNANDYCFIEKREEILENYNKFIQYYKDSSTGGYILMSFKEKNLNPVKQNTFKDEEICAVLINNEWKLAKRLVYKTKDVSGNEKTEIKYLLQFAISNNTVHYKVNNSISDDDLYEIDIYYDQEFNKFNVKNYLNNKFGSAIGNKNFAKVWVNNSQFISFLNQTKFE